MDGRSAVILYFVVCLVVGTSIRGRVDAPYSSEQASITTTSDLNRPTDRPIDRPIDIVLDFDWTLADPITKEQMIEDDPDFIAFGDHYFRIADGTREFVRSILANRNVRVSVYSGGDRDRIEHILRQIDVGQGLNLYEAAHQVLTSSDLVPVNDARADAAFSERYKKDLTRISPSVTLDRALILEDIENFVVPGQEKNVVFLQRTYKFSEQFEAAHAGETYMPSTESAYSLSRNRLAWALGVIQAGLDRLNAGESLPNAVDRIQRGEGAHRLDRESLNSLPLYERGLHLMLIQNRNMRRVPIVIPNSMRCEDIFASAQPRLRPN